MGLAARVARVAMRRRRAVLALSLALGIASLISLAWLRLDVDLLETLPTGAPAFDEYRAFLRDFGATQTLLVLVEAPEGGPLGETLDRLAARYRALPEIAAVHGGLEVGEAAPFLDPLHVPALVPTAAMPVLAERLEPAVIADALERAKRLLALPSGGGLGARVSRDPLGVAAIAGSQLAATYADPLARTGDRHLVTPEGDAGLLLLRPVGSPFDAEFTARLFAALAGAEADVRAALPSLARMRVRHAGSYAHAHEDAALIEGDVMRYTLLALVGVIVIFHVGFRNLAVLPLVAYPLIAGSLLAFASSVLLYGSLNALSLSFAAIFYGLAIDSGIHFYARLAAEQRDDGLEAAIARTCDGIGAANLVASLTTAAAFAVVSFSAIAAVRQIGVLTALGMLINVAHTFLVLPALTASMPGLFPRGRAPREEAPGVGWIAGHATRHAGVVTALALLAFAGWAAAGGAVPVDAEILHLRPAGSAVTRAEDVIAARFATLTPQGVVLVTGGDLEEALVREERVVAWLAQARTAAEPHVLGYQALSTFLPSRATEEARRRAFAALPLAEARRTLAHELARQHFRPAAFADAARLFAAPAARLPRDLDAPWLRALAERHLRRGAAGVTLAVYVEPAPGTTLAALRAELHRALDPPATVTGRPLMQAALAAVIEREVVWFTAATLALNVAIVAVRLGSLGFTLAVMAPTVVIVFALLAGMQLAGIPFTPINLIVLPLMLGIGVDDCVYLAERVREGLAVEEATRRVGRAIALTTLTTMTGFGFLAVSRYPGLASLGWLAAGAIALTFVAAIVLLPAFLSLRERRPARG